MYLSSQMKIIILDRGIFFANFNSPVKSSVVILSIEKLDLFKGIYAREVAANLRMHG